MLISEMVCFALGTLSGVGMCAMGLQRRCCNLWSHRVLSKQVSIFGMPKWCEINAFKGEIGEVQLCGSEEGDML